MTYLKIPEDEYGKAKGQLQMQAVGIFDFLKVDEKVPIRYMYGMGAFVDGSITEIVKL